VAPKRLPRHSRLVRDANACPPQTPASRGTDAIKTRALKTGTRGQIPAASAFKAQLKMFRRTGTARDVARARKKYFGNNPLKRIGKKKLKERERERMQMLYHNYILMSCAGT